MCTCTCCQREQTQHAQAFISYTEEFNKLSMKYKAAQDKIKDLEWRLGHVR